MPPRSLSRPQLGREQIAARIPHAGGMCLLDAVLESNAERIVCQASTHRAADNPLRSAGRLSAVCGIEYAAQAMAVHGSLSDPDSVRPRTGFLASVRGVTTHVETLDDVAFDLSIEARRESGDNKVVVYAFTIREGDRSDGRLLLEGRATVILDAVVVDSVGSAQ